MNVWRDEGCGACGGCVTVGELVGCVADDEAGVFGPLDEWSLSVPQDEPVRSALVELGAAGEMFVAVSTYSAGRAVGGLTVIKYDQRGAPQWSKTLPSARTRRAVALAVDERGGVCVLGVQRALVGSADQILSEIEAYREAGALR